MQVTPKGSLLITGGAGYIGSHTVLAFRQADYPVVVLDDLSTGQHTAVPDDIIFIEGDVGNIETVSAIVAKHGVTAVVHFAGSTSVFESTANPLKYYCNNVSASTNLIRACVQTGVKRFVFSSTAAVYGIPAALPVTEDMPAMPINPYGSSKLATEWVLRDTAVAHDFRYIALRYFNVAGADPQRRIGQSTSDSTHLIKVVSEAVVGLRDHINVFGTDYDTPDGTCIRDYIHVSDLADAHVAALSYLESGGSNEILNCGYGHGFSVLEVLNALQVEAGVVLDIRNGLRRTGDPPALVADTAKLQAVLDWSPRYDDLGFIVRTAIEWEEKLNAVK